MQKFLVIDSLARSGTTLLSSLIRTQDKCITFDGSFIESLEFTSNRKSLQQYKEDTFFMVGGGHSGPRLSMGLKPQEWKEILNHFSSWDEVDKFYTLLANKFESDVIGFRWNQSLPYAKSWISRSTYHYWLALVRDPRDRTVSNKKTHGWPFEKCLKTTTTYGEQLDKWLNVKHPQFILVYYEDLIANPQKVLSKVFKIIGYPLTSIKTKELIGCDNKPYRQQGWRVKERYGDHKIGEKYTKIHTNSVGQYEDYLNNNEIDMLNKEVEKYNVYKKYR